MNIFVTGGTGFLGRQVVKRLLDDGHHVRCLARPASDCAGTLETLTSGAESRLEWMTGALGRIKPAQLVGCEVVCHIAASMKGSTAALFIDNVVGTRRLLEASQVAAVRRFVHVSSLAVHGTSHLRAGDLLDETCSLDDRPHDRDPYTYSKVAAENLAWEAHRAGACAVVVVRPGVIYGPGRDPLTNRVGLCVGRTLLRMGSRHLLPYVHVAACADGVARAVTTAGIEGQAFNLLDERLVTAREFLKDYRRHHRNLRVIPIPYWAVRPLSRFNRWYCEWSQGQLPAVLTPYKSDAMWKPLRYTVEKARSGLDWKPWPDTREGILQLLRS
jgi:nucleoside-diphosphate-sugar epimerase